MKDLFTKNSIRTVSGIFVNLADPDPRTINIEDIAHALDNMPRFGGHLPEQYTVLDHSLFVASLVDDEYKLEALLHDATEAYLMDIPAPLKELLPEYKKIERNMYVVIAELFGIPKETTMPVKDADRMALMFEWATIMKRNTPFEATFQPDRMKQFLALFHSLTNGTGKEDFE